MVALKYTGPIGPLNDLHDGDLDAVPAYPAEEADGKTVMIGCLRDIAVVVELADDAVRLVVELVLRSVLKASCQQALLLPSGFECHSFVIDQWCVFYQLLVISCEVVDREWLEAVPHGDLSFASRVLRLYRE